MSDDFDPYDDDLEDDEDDLYVDECGMGHDGQCSMAGSEWCDWDCPIMAQHARARIAAMKRETKP